MKPSKSNVARAAARLGAKFEVERDSVFICAPAGYHFADDTYGCHYSEWPTDYCAKAEAYKCCLAMIEGGIERCEPGCDCEEAR